MDKLFGPSFLDALCEHVDDSNIESVDRDGRSLLTNAVLLNNEDAIKFLVSKGANINTKDHCGRASLHFAAIHHRLPILELLIKYGADVNIQDKYGSTPLANAVFESRGRGEIINALLMAGADPHIQDNYGTSAYDLANKIANFNVNKFFK